MDIPEDIPQPSQTASSELNFPSDSPLPEGFTPIEELAHLSAARRRRARRSLVPPGADERAALLASLARRAFPSFEFFLFSFLCGAVLGAAYLLNAPALLLLGVLLAPLLTPWVGMTLAVITGSWRFFFQTLLSLALAGLLVFLTSALAGLTAQLLTDPVFFYARIHAQLWWTDLLVTALGAILLTVSFVRSEQKPVLASIMLAYGLFLPLSTAGIGLGIGYPVQGIPLWPNGLLVALVHLCLATLLGALVLLAMRFRPTKPGGFLLPLIVLIASLTALVSLTRVVDLVRENITGSRHTPEAPIILASPTSLPTLRPTGTQVPTLLPSATVTATATLEPTPALAVIVSSFGGGANLRSEPGGGNVLQVLTNGITVLVLPETVTLGTDTWTRVRTQDGTEGWVVTGVLAFPTLTSPLPVTPTP
jgi:hypothetical protein